MFSRNRNEAVKYSTLDDLIVDLVASPGEPFIRHQGCEALVYIPEINEILLLRAKDLPELDAVCPCDGCMDEAFKRLIDRIRAEHAV